MRYDFDFSWTIEYAPMLAYGVVTTVWLTIVGTVGGFMVGLGAAWMLTWGPARLRFPFVAYVEIMRNTPFLIQLFFIFFGLPQFGISLPAWGAAIIASSLNIGAYSCEIIRAGIGATPRGQVEAGLSLAMSRLQVFRYVVLVPSLEKVWPALSSQFVIVMLGTAVVSQISVPDLTFAANFIQARNFRSFESYIVTLVIYLALAVILRLAMDSIGRRLFAGRRA
jgi:polar amino acid transport system permease protein